MTAAAYGGRAKCAQRLIRLDMPVPTTVALSFAAVHELAQGHALNLELGLAAFWRGAFALSAAILRQPRLGRAGRDFEHWHE